jgi:26S proteasome non-ATPase regulatory subunit 5
MIKSLGEMRYGFKFLEKYFKHLLSYLVNTDDILNEKFLVPGIIKFFGSLSYYYPKEIHENSSQFYIFLLNNILLENSHDPDIQIKIELSIETLTLVLKNNESKYILFNYYKDLLVDRVFKQILKFIQYSINNLRLKSIDLLSSLIAINFKKNLILNNNINIQDASELSLNLFTSFISNIDRVNKHNAMEKLFNILLNYAKQPFMELRLKSHDCFQSFTQSKWGLNYLFNLSNSGNNFIIYLIDRSTELEKEGRNSKYDLVKLVASSEFIMEYIDLNQLSILNRFVKEGPFYKESEMAVEFQNA